MDNECVMAGLVPAIHVLLSAQGKTWMPGTRPGMTRLRFLGDGASASAQDDLTMAQDLLA
jgi:hypothetical protein